MVFVRRRKKKKLQKKNGGASHHLTVKFHQKFFSSVIHLDKDFHLFEKPKTPTKVKILEKEKNIASKISKKSWTDCFFLPKYSFCVFLNECMI